eukprot:TRINITY_DN17599_c0_g1_i1.p1 TRINITY_DN17599_c0_g1~~TRINITY_DN17599_c0_g1_i1.p1  ORF type:complete len:316 (+),score=58.71 TRINITY_DN17599_c0_g1_i1:58-1005(+)
MAENPTAKKTFYHGDRDSSVSEAVAKVTGLTTPRFFENDEFPLTRILEENWEAIRHEFQQLHEHLFCPWPERGLFYSNVLANQPNDRDPAVSANLEGLGAKIKSKTQKIVEGVGWNVFGLYAFGKRNEVNCKLCPITAGIVEKMGVMTAAFSVLNPEAHIVPHSGYFGYSNRVLRIHLGLDIPDTIPDNLARDVIISDASQLIPPLGNLTTIDEQGTQRSTDLAAPHVMKDELLYRQKGFPLPLGIKVADEVCTWENGKCLVFDDLHIHTAWNYTKQPRAVLLIDIPRPEKYQMPNPFSADQGDYLDQLTAAFGY